MKKILIIALVIFLAIFSYAKYQTYKRFNPPSDYDHIVNNNIDSNYHDPLVVKDYFKHSSGLGLYARKVWANKRIDVLHPDEDDVEAELYVSQYTDKLVRIKHLENILIYSKELKDQGFNNKDIEQIELTGMSPKDYQFQKSFENARFNLMEGDEGQTVAMIQQKLVDLGYEIPVDGKFKALTKQAVMEIQEKAQLIPTGTVDKYTLKAIIKD